MTSIPPTSPTPSPSSAATGTGTGSGAAATATQANSAAMSQLSGNMNTFLTLLTTQLKNQDPLSPLDTNQFTQQLVQLSQVEQAINTNTNLGTLISLQSTNAMTSALPLVGKTVQFSGSQTVLTNGQAEFGYSLPAAASNTTLSISNSSGQVVYQGTGQTAAGNYTFNWNGQGSDGSTEPSGVYTMTVTAQGLAGSTVTPTVTAFGTVGSVLTSSGTPSFTVGSLTEPLSSIVGVTAAPASASTTSTPAN